MHSLEQLLEESMVWRKGWQWRGQSATPTGHAVLDEHLPGAGWPRSGLSDFLLAQPGIGELRLLMPGLSYLSQAEPRWLVWVNPPYIPYAPALLQHGVDLSKLLVIQAQTQREQLWAIEQCLKSGSCAAVLCWPPNMLNKDWRRLHLAAQTGKAWCVAFRPAQAARQPSPAPLRALLDCDPKGFFIRILKRPGGWASDNLYPALPSPATPTRHFMQPATAATAYRHVQLTPERRVLSFSELTHNEVDHAMAQEPVGLLPLS